MQRLRLFSALLIVLILAACSPKDSSQASTDSSNAPHANVVLRDGTKLSGTVKSSTPSELTLNLDDGSTRTVLTKDIKSMDYGDAKGSAPTQEAKNEAPATPALPRPEKTAIQTKTFVIPAGSEVSVRNDETIDSANASDGQTYAAEVTVDVKDSDGAVVIPRGANALLVIKSAAAGGKIRGASDLVVDLKSVSVGGQQYALNTTDLEEKGKNGIGANKRTGEFLGGGAALGGIIGAIAGGGKGAAIGAAIGGIGGALTQILTKGGSIRIPAETVMTFKLDQAVKIIERK